MVVEVLFSKGIDRNLIGTEKTGCNGVGWVVNEWIWKGNGEIQ